jgi:DNA invertase Pin-like site-specific DNA recombinase
MRVAIYARVSTNGKNGNGRAEQDTDNQLLALREWCDRSGHEVVAEYVERKSGGKGADKRTELARLLEDAHQRRFDIVLCWALDRFSREGMIPTIGYLQRLAASRHRLPLVQGADVVDRQRVNSGYRSCGYVFACQAGAVASCRAGSCRIRLERARIKGTKSGKAIGRPWLDKRKEVAIRAELERGTGILKTARLCKVGTGTVQRIKRQMTAG